VSKAVKINWSDQARIRDRAAGKEAGSKQAQRLKKDRKPLFYLLMPEIHQLVALEKDRQKQLLYLTLWYTGARLSDVLSLKPASLKKVTGGMVVKFADHYEVPVLDMQFRTLLMKHIRQKKIRKNDKIWNVTRQTVNRWHHALMDIAIKKPAFKGMTVNIATYRHSFAMNWLIHSAPVHLLERIMNFKHSDRVAHYIQYLEYDRDSYFQTVKFR